MSFNAHPMVLLLLGALRSDPEPTEQRVMQAAVHAWMEGHVSAAGHPPPGGTDERFPTPPFPASGSERLREIIDETMERFDPIQIMPAVAYASALAWIEGEADGAHCTGCAIRNADTDAARAIRNGEVEIRFHHPELDTAIFG